MMTEADQELFKRYRKLIAYLHHYGYGTFVVTMHGRKPVAVTRLLTPTRLDQTENETGGKEPAM